MVIKENSIGKLLIMAKVVLFNQRVISVTACAPMALLMAADFHGISPSDALKRGIEVLIAEKETGAIAAKQSAPISSPKGEPV
ncbi:MAG: hypothetical protein WCX22_01930 [Methanoregula sp.]